MTRPSASNGSANVICIGDAFMGKTSLLLRRRGQPFDPSPAPTIESGLAMWDQTLSNGVSIKLNVYDTAGQERYRSPSYIFYREAQVAIVCCTVEDPYEKQLNSLREWCQTVREKANPECQLILAITKSDLVNETGRRTATENLARLTAKLGAITGYITSAKNGDGVDELFDAVAMHCEPKVNQCVVIDSPEKGQCCS
jgi:small GTP-binding protein